MNLERLKANSALTLTELLVVIAIVGMLAALFLPTLSRAQQKAQQIQCIGNLHQLGIGLHNLLANGHGYPVIIGTAAEGIWIGQLEREGFGIARPETNFYQKGVWLCPSARWNGIVDFTPSGYGYNRYGVLYPGNATNDGFGLQGHFNTNASAWTPIAETEVVLPSEMMAMGDSFDASVEFNRKKLSHLETYGNTLARHQGKANVVFCDGHVESPTLQFLFQDTNDVALVRWNRDHLPHREKLAP